MRPIKLELSYIGPYEAETIDFQDINRTLFLISGKTGSGKSMIFDAITHALFATASTNARGSESLRSQFAPSTHPSIIRFTFNYRENVYTVERQLRYFKENNKNETPPESAVYDEEGELIESGLTKVTSFITDLLQIDAVQFRQIGLLPQGEFRKFLVASSNDKEQILKALFRTERFNALYRKLKTEHDEEKKALDLSFQLMMNTFRKEIEETLISESLKENMKFLEQKESDLSTYLKGKKKEQDELKETLEALATHITEIEANNTRIAEYKREKNRLETVLTGQPKIEEKEKQLHTFNKVNTIKDAYQSAKQNKELYNHMETEVSDLEKNLLETTKKLEKTEQELEELLKGAEKIEEKRKQIKTLSKFDTEEYQEIESTIKQIEKNVEDKNHSIEGLKKEIATLEEKRAQTSVDENELLTIQETVFDIRKNLDDLTREKETAEANEKHASKLQQLKAKLNDLNEKEEKLQQDISKQNSELKTVEGLNIQNINTLISHLEVGQPCMVCQQTVEKLPEEIVYDVQLYEKLEDIQKTNQKITTEYEVLKNFEIKETRSVESIEEEIESLISKINFEQQKQKEIEIAIETMHALDEQLKKETIHLQKLENQLEILTHDLKTYNHRLNHFKKETGYSDFMTFKDAYLEQEKSISLFDKSKQELTEQKNEETLNLTKVQSMRDNKAFKRDTYEELWKHNQEKFDTFISNHQEIDAEKIDDILNIDIERLSTEIDHFYHSVREIESIIKNIETQITSFETVDLEEKVENYKSLNNRIDRNHKEMGQLEHQLETLGKTIDTLTKQVKEYKEKEEAFIKLAKFVDLLNGKHGNPTLSRFVLVYYLELILAQANIRLRKMTNGRYELRRVNSYRSDQSLHIDVFDYFNNARRSVATLSGGESFQAALALALALSEIIQHEAGSIDMDMLLIDEGFGTLDEETLKVAIDTLFSLQQTGKMIGIISHVEELKTMIGNILYVETEDERSKTRLVTPLTN